MGINHGGELPDGVAEKFIAWAKSEHLSFWKQYDKTTNNIGTDVIQHSEACCE